AEVDEKMTLPDTGLDWGQLLQNPMSFWTDPVWASLRLRFGSGLGDLLQFSKSQGIMHHAAYAAVDAHSWVSGQITEHLDEPELTLEKKAHAELIRQIFGNKP